jgi:hypothetical protein
MKSKIKNILKYINEHPREIFAIIFIATAYFCLKENNVWLTLALLPVVWSRRDAFVYPVHESIENHYHASGLALRALAAYYICPHEFIYIYAFYFWIMFDGCYNKFTNKNWNFIGSSAELDKLLHWLGGNWLKYAGLTGALACFLFKKYY